MVKHTSKRETRFREELSCFGELLSLLLLRDVFGCLLIMIKTVHTLYPVVIHIWVRYILNIDLLLILQY